MGHTDRMGGGVRPTSWNSAHAVPSIPPLTTGGCALSDLMAAGGIGGYYGARLAAQKEGLQRLTNSTDWTVHLHRTYRPPQTVLLALYLAMADLRRLNAA